MIRPIRLYGDPVLRRAARNVTRFDEALRGLAADMIDTMIDADGLGLAAPQVGVARRLFVVAGAADPERTPRDDDAPEPTLEEQRASAIVFVNPTLRGLGGAQTGIEGCLSIPGLYHDAVERHAVVGVRYQDLSGAWHERSAEGRFAVVLQHEADHLDGVLFIDRLPGGERSAFMEEHRSDLAQMQRDAKAALRGGGRPTAGPAT
jgi:peptide deformylase